MSITLKTVVKRQRKDGFWPVYIRVTNSRMVGYWNTNKLVNNEGLDSSGEIIDQFVLEWCARLSQHWISQLNHVEYEAWSPQEIIDYVTRALEDVSFSDYARCFISKIDNEGRTRTAKNYRLSLNHLELYMGTTDIKFSQLTVAVLRAWIDTMVKSGKKRCKEMYPVCIRQIWKQAMKDLNDDERDIVQVKTNPWLKISIPKSDDANEKAIAPVMLRKFFSVPLPESRNKLPLTEFGRDVAKIAFCLGGMYAVDLYELKASDYYDGVIHYHRAKTRDKRSDRAYMEMRVPDLLLPLFKKYKPKKFKKDRLFSFAEMYSNEDSFCSNANIGIRKISRELLGCGDEDDYSIKTFRHTWATIARNYIEGTTMEQVAFALNHASAHRVTEIYVDKDFSPAWELNDKVIEFVFMSDDPGTKHQQEKKLDTDRISKDNMMRGMMFYQGKMLCEVRDTGFTNKKQIVDMLASRLPDDVPDRAIVQFVVENIDKGGMWMYEHQVGKGI